MARANVKRFLWCPRCQLESPGADHLSCERHRPRRRPWRRVAGILLLGIIALLVAAILGAYSAAHAATADQDQTFDVETGACSIFELPTGGERWADSYGAWLQALAGLKPRRGWWGLACFANGAHGGRITGVLLDRRGLKRCTIEGKWWKDEKVCVQMSATCPMGLDIMQGIGSEVCAL